MSRELWVSNIGFGRPHVHEDGCESGCHRVVVIDPAEIPHLDDFYNGNPCAALNIIADDVRDIGQGDLDATEQIVRWLAEQMPTPPPCATCLDKTLHGFTCNACGNGADS